MHPVTINWPLWIVVVSVGWALACLSFLAGLYRWHLSRPYWFDHWTNRVEHKAAINARIQRERLWTHAFMLGALGWFLIGLGVLAVLSIYF